MSMEAPQIDPRTRADLVAETEDLAEALSGGWRRPVDGQPDAGRALIQVFARFAELVVDRLNRSPQKNYLAFLDLIGTTPLPPRPATAPIAFTVTPGTPVAPVVPQGTRVGGPPIVDGQDEVVFETASPLVCTTATLVATWSSDTETDTAADRTASATGAEDAAFGVFGDDGMPVTPHELYLACDPLFDTAVQTAAAAARSAATARAADLARAADAARSAAAVSAGAAARAAAVAATAAGASSTAASAAASATGTASAAATTAATAAAATAKSTAATADTAAADAVAADAAATRAADAAVAAADPNAIDAAADAAGEAAAGGRVTVTVSIATSHLWQWSTWPVSWACWDGSGWQPVDAVGSPVGGTWRVTLRDVSPQPTEIGGVTARWLRARLALPLPPPETGLGPEALAVGARPVEAAYPVAPFDGSRQRFYLAADDAFSAGGAVARLHVTLSRPGVAPAALRVNWTYQTADGWQSLGQSEPSVSPPGTGFQDGTRGLTTDGTVTIPIPLSWPQTLYWTRWGRWLRLEVTGDAAYTTTPEISSLRVDVDWDLPTVDRLTIATAGAPIPPPACVTVNDFAVVDRSDAVAQGPAFAPFTPTADTEPALYLAFDAPFELRPVVLHLQVEPPRPEEVAADRLAGLDPAARPRVAWEYSGPAGWRPLGALDGTAGFTVRGELRFPGPADLTARRCFGRDGYWLRARWTGGTFALPPRLRRVLTNTVWASHVASVDDEILGSGTGNAAQTFTAAQTPVQPGQRLLVRERERPAPDEERALVAEEGDDAVTVLTDATGLPDEVWVRWHAVPDLYGSGPRDRHYVIDAVTGVVRFGDGTAGMAPPPGQNNVRLTYRAGGGEAGNRPAGTLVELRSAIPSVEGVVNLEAAGGGADAEPLDHLAARGPRVLRHRDRAVAASDLEDLAAEASPDVARAVAIVPSFNPYTLWLDPGGAATVDHQNVAAGRVGLIVVPRSGATRPAPDLGLLREVRAYLARRLPVTADLWVAGPEWVAVTVDAVVVPVRVDDGDAVAAAVRAALAGFLHPLTGGAGGGGWAFGGRPRRSELIALVEAVEGVDHVRSLVVSFRPETEDVDQQPKLRAVLERPLREIAGQTPPAPELLAWLRRALVYSGPHTVAVAFDA
jgi:Baseplate J-like protein